MSRTPQASIPDHDTNLSGLDLVRVVNKPTAVKAAGVSPRTWDRMEANGETPPITRISERRIGYRLLDLMAWLDARRVRREDDHDRRERCTVYSSKKA
jgi:hypothetical protein